MYKPLDTYLRDVSTYPLLTKEKELFLGRRIRDGNTSALHELVCSNLRLVVWAACRRRKPEDPMFLDLVSEGNLGLMLAAKRFNPDAGARFSTYALFWIQQRMHRCLERSCKAIRIPNGALAEARLLEKILEIRSNELGVCADHQELAEELGIEPATLSKRLKTVVTVVSFDAALDESSERTLLDLVPDKASEDAEQETHRKDIKSLVTKLLKQLPPKEHEILRRRYGLDGTTAGTLEQVGRVMGISRNRVQFLQVQALGRLKCLLEQRAEGSLHKMSLDELLQD